LSHTGTATQLAEKQNYLKPPTTSLVTTEIISQPVAIHCPPVLRLFVGMQARTPSNGISPHLRIANFLNAMPCFLNNITILQFLFSFFTFCVTSSMFLLSDKK